MPESTGGIGWMKGSIGSRSVRAMVSAAPAAAFRTTMRLRRRTVATTAKSPTPQPRKSSDSYMFEAGIRPATCQRIPMPQLMTAKPAKRRAPATRSRARRSVAMAAIDSSSESVSTHHAMRVGRARL